MSKLNMNRQRRRKQVFGNQATTKMPRQKSEGRNRPLRFPRQKNKK